VITAEYKNPAFVGRAKVSDFLLGLISKECDYKHPAEAGHIKIGAYNVCLLC